MPRSGRGAARWTPPQSVDRRCPPDGCADDRGPVLPGRHHQRYTRWSSSCGRRQTGSSDLEAPTGDYLPAAVTSGIHVIDGTDRGPTIALEQLLFQTSGLAGYFAGNQKASPAWSRHSTPAPAGLSPSRILRHWCAHSRHGSYPAHRGDGKPVSRGGATRTPLQSRFVGPRRGPGTAGPHPLFLVRARFRSRSTIAWARSKEPCSSSGGTAQGFVTRQVRLPL